MGVRTETKIKNDLPGPGEYKVPEKVVEGPKFGFGTSARKFETKEDSPGPGYYKIPVKVAVVEKHIIPNQNEDFKYV